MLTNSSTFKLTLVLLIGIISFYSCRTTDKTIIGTNTTTHKNKAELDNRFLIVNKSKSVYANGSDSSISDRVIIALNEVEIRSRKRNIRLIRGECAVFQFAESYAIIKGDYFEVSIKKNHPKPAKPKVWHEPTKNASVFENEDFRIFREQLGAGEERAFHSHLERLVVRLNKVQLTDPRFYPNGQEGVGIQEPNTVKFAEPVEHVVKNLGKIPLFNIVLEFKPQ